MAAFIQGIVPGFEPYLVGTQQPLLPAPPPASEAPDVVIPRGLTPEDLEKLGKTIEKAYAENTRQAYRSCFSLFCTWCEARGATSLPADPLVVAVYLRELGRDSQDDDRSRTPLRYRRRAPPRGISGPHDHGHGERRPQGAGKDVPPAPCPGQGPHRRGHGEGEGHRLYPPAARWGRGPYGVQ